MEKRIFKHRIIAMSLVEAQATATTHDGIGYLRRQSGGNAGRFLRRQREVNGRNYLPTAAEKR
jgi:hypothetical protein